MTSLVRTLFPSLRCLDFSQGRSTHSLPTATSSTEKPTESTEENNISTSKPLEAHEQTQDVLIAQTIMKMVPCTDSIISRLQDGLSKFETSSKGLDPTLPNIQYSTIVSAQLIRRISDAHTQCNKDAYAGALLDLSIFKGCVDIYYYLTGKQLVVKVKHEMYGYKLIKGVVVLPETFEDPFFKQIPELIRGFLFETLSNQDLINREKIKLLIQAISPSCPNINTRLLPNLPIDMKKFIGKMTNGFNRTIFIKYPSSSLPLEGLYEILENLLPKMASKPFEEIEINRRFPGYLTLHTVKTRSGDGISFYVFATERELNPIKSTHCMVRFGKKVSTGKEIAIKSDKMGNGLVQKEANALKAIHDAIREDQENLFSKYPEGFIETAKGKKIVVIQSRPHTFLMGSHVMITDKCDSSALEFRVEFSPKIHEELNNYLEADHDALYAIRGAIKHLRAYEKDLFNNRITSNDFKTVKEQVQALIDKQNKKLIGLYQTIEPNRRKALTDDEIKIRQKKMMAFCLKAFVGLAILHSLKKHGYTHGDLKPENIFIINKSQNPTPVIGDFYSARQLLDPEKYPNFFEGESIYYFNNGTETYISEKAHLQNTIAYKVNRSRIQYHAVQKASERFAKASIAFYELTGMRIPHTYKLVRSLNGELMCCVLPHELAYQDSVFLLLPEDVQNILKRFLEFDVDVSLDAVIEIFRKHLAEPG